MNFEPTGFSELEPVIRDKEIPENILVYFRSTNDLIRGFPILLVFSYCVQAGKLLAEFTMTPIFVQKLFNFNL